MKGTEFDYDKYMHGCDFYIIWLQHKIQFISQTAESVMKYRSTLKNIFILIPYFS